MEILNESEWNTNLEVGDQNKKTHHCMYSNLIRIQIMSCCVTQIKLRFNYQKSDNSIVEIRDIFLHMVVLRTRVSLKRSWLSISNAFLEIRLDPVVSSK